MAQCANKQMLRQIDPFVSRHPIYSESRSDNGAGRSGAKRDGALRVLQRFGERGQVFVSKNANFLVAASCAYGRCCCSVPRPHCVGRRFNWRLEANSSRAGPTIPTCRSRRRRRKAANINIRSKRSMCA